MHMTNAQSQKFATNRSVPMQMSGSPTHQQQMVAFKKGDNTTMIGISKDHFTGTTGFTSNPDTFAASASQGIGGPMSFNMHDTTGVPSQAGQHGADILSYPYAYDQDPKPDVDFSEKLYRAGQDENLAI